MVGAAAVLSGAGGAAWVVAIVVVVVTVVVVDSGIHGDQSTRAVSHARLTGLAISERRAAPAKWVGDNPQTLWAARRNAWLRLGYQREFCTATTGFAAL
jgi:hypothetical protein